MEAELINMSLINICIFFNLQNGVLLHDLIPWATSSEQVTIFYRAAIL